MHKSSLIIPAVFLLIGFISAYVIFGEKTIKNNSVSAINKEQKVNELFSSINPFVEKKENPEYSNPDFSHRLDRNRLDHYDDEISQIKQQLKEIEQTLALMSDTAPASTNPVNITRNRSPSFLPPAFV